MLLHHHLRSIPLRRLLRLREGDVAEAANLVLALRAALILVAEVIGLPAGRAALQHEAGHRLVVPVGLLLAVLASSGQAEGVIELWERNLIAQKGYLFFG